MFHRQRKNSLSGQIKSLKDLSRMVTPVQFLAENKREALLQQMKDYSGLEASRYDSLCLVLIENLVSYCQQLPETANGYYAHPGGLVDHALNRTEAALSLFQEFMPVAPGEQLSEEQKLWQYVLYSAALLQGIGKLVVDYKINLFDANGHLLKAWNPLLESLTDTGNYYDYELQKESEIEFRRRLNLLLAKMLMPHSGFAWIASNPQVLAIWLALLNEDPRAAGTLGAILIRADAIAIQRYLTEYMLRGGVHRSGRYGKAGTFSGGTPEELLEKEQAMGAEFIQWLQKSLAEGLILINKAPLFMVPGGLLMSQEMFQLFIREHPEYKNWQAVQKGFLALGLHGVGTDGGVISRFEQAHNQQMHQGILFTDYAVALPASVSVHHLGSGKTESLTAIDVVHRAQINHQFSQVNSSVVAPLQQINAGGQWQNKESLLTTSAPGVIRGG